jgi:hypothetical protein
MSNFKNPKIPPTGGRACRTHILARLRCAERCHFRPAVVEGVTRAVDVSFRARGLHFENIAAFRNDANPKIAVTVDLHAHADIVVSAIKKAFAKTYGDTHDAPIKKITGSVDRVT